MTIDDLANIIQRVCGLSENWAKTCIYYAMATHKLNRFSWFPALAFIGSPGTGKSKTMDALELLAYRPYRIICHSTMTPVALRDDLVAARNRTAIIEECDLYPNRKQLQGYLINRVDKIRTSGLPVKEQIETDTGLKEWHTRHRKIFGATIIHDRHSLDDLATESRAIVINTVFKPGPYIDPPKGMCLPSFTLGEVPDPFTYKTKSFTFNNRGRAFDTWKPLIMVANGVGDNEWLHWAWLQIEEAMNSLRDGQFYEEKLAIFAGVIEAYCDNSGIGLIVKDPITIKSVVEKVKTEMPWIHSKTVAKVLRKFGLNVRLSSGTARLFTTVDELERVANEIGYQDEVMSK